MSRNRHLFVYLCFVANLFVDISIDEQKKLFVNLLRSEGL